MDECTQVLDFSILRITEMYSMNNGPISSFEADARRYASNYNANYDYNEASRFGGGGWNLRNLSRKFRSQSGPKDFGEFMHDVESWIKKHKRLLIALAIIVVLIIVIALICVYAPGSKSSFGPSCPTCGKLRRK